MSPHHFFFFTSILSLTNCLRLRLRPHPHPHAHAHAHTHTHTQVALVEFRSRQTVGLAAVDALSPQLVLSQFSDNYMYTNALMMLSRFDPVTVLMSDTAADSTLLKLVQTEVRTAYNGAYMFCNYYSSC